MSALFSRLLYFPLIPLPELSLVRVRRSILARTNRFKKCDERRTNLAAMLFVLIFQLQLLLNVCRFDRCRSMSASFHLHMSYTSGRHRK